MNVRRRFFVEAGLAGAFALLFLVTLVWPDWIELVFEVEPDGGDGSFEWEFVVMFAVIAVAAAALARMEWRRARAPETEATHVR